MFFDLGFPKAEVLWKGNICRRVLTNDKLIYLSPLLQSTWRSFIDPEKHQILAGRKITDAKRTNFKFLTTSHMLLYGTKKSYNAIAKTLCH